MFKVEFSLHDTGVFQLRIIFVLSAERELRKLTKIKGTIKSSFIYSSAHPAKHLSDVFLVWLYDTYCLCLLYARE
jgi:hypothetical protein